jgi:hypothetical protein
MFIGTVSDMLVGLRRSLAGLLLMVLAFVGLAQAADVTGSIDGVVKDQSGAVAGGIEVSVTNRGIGHK